MATRRCPECGAQYVASVRRCIDCEVVLVDDRDPGQAPSTDPVPIGSGERVSYELDGWGNQLKVTLEGMLDNAGIKRLWEVGALVVDASDAPAVEQLIATVEGRDLDELADLEEQLAFEIEGLDADDAAELDARLLAAGIVHAWSDEGELLVSVDQEDEVTAIVEAVIEGAAGANEVDGLAANQALSDLYVAVDRLVNDPDSSRNLARLTAAAAVVEPMGVPYGFAAGEWSALKARVASLVALADPATDLPGDEAGDGEGSADLDDPAVDEDRADDGPPGGDDPDDGDGRASEDPLDSDDGLDAADLDDDEDAGDEDDDPRRARLVRSAGALREQLLDWV
jgi:hypothetical protein